jgi:hypothetical protein
MNRLTMSPVHVRALAERDPSLTSTVNDSPCRKLREGRSRDDVRRQLILDGVDAVAQLQFPLLQSLNLEEIGPRRSLQCLNRGIEVAMFLSQARELRPEFSFLFLGHRRRCAYVE